MTDTIEATSGRKATKGGLTGLKIAELKDVASRLGITGTGKMRKDDLVAAISSRQSGTAPASSGGSAGSAAGSGGSAAGSGGSAAGSGGSTAPAAAPASAAAAASADAGASGRSRGSRRVRAAGGVPASAQGDTAAANAPEPRGEATERADRPARADRADRAEQAERADSRDQSERPDLRERPEPSGSADAEPGSRERFARNRDGQQSERPRQQDRQAGQYDRQQAQDRQSDQDRQGGQQGSYRERQQGTQGQLQGGQQQGQSRFDDDMDSRGGRRRNRQRSRDRKRGRGSMGLPMGGQDVIEAEVQIAEDDVIVPVAGILDIMDNYAFVRTSGYLPGPGDVYVPLGLVRRHGLRKGDAVTGAVKALREGEVPTAQAGSRGRFNPLVRLDTVNGMSPEQAKTRVEFAKLTPLYPQERLRLETAPSIITTRVVDLVSPIGKGQRGLIVSPPKAGKTLILQAIANAITTNNPEVHLMVVLVDERPEEVTDMQRTVRGEVIASTFDRPAEDHTTVAELAIERAKRLVELGHDVVILLDGITRLGRAYNLAAPASGRILSGGVDSAALYPPKKFFGAARNIEDGGSLTILATALVETGSKMDEVIFEEFKGTGNWELKLSRQLANRRIYPAVDVNASGTRREDILMSTEELRIMWKLRRVLSALDETQGIELLLDRLKKTKSNLEFLVQVQRTSSIKLDDEKDD